MSLDQLKNKAVIAYSKKSPMEKLQYDSTNRNLLETTQKEYI